ncbi:hypothetical protein Aasi_1726 [Candidatus Amoebophilus asiaticus 5a2]|uniref:Uncharacterized protein n=1 Tax=Amoebophilus asiaticus (strain 5a2) TaxID=452471 RepID=C3L3W7_AMOA5|nr:hypothetical protein [Candidatus Amoebophilus asiaticus]ACP21008.1 hypothetical protein Aasi_1726 [Candidatus Amoebophilus asiaticus 5a2]
MSIILLRAKQHARAFDNRVIFIRMLFDLILFTLLFKQPPIGINFYFEKKEEEKPEKLVKRKRKKRLV